MLTVVEGGAEETTALPSHPSRLLDSGRAAVGGQHHRDDLFIAPTVLTDVDPASPVMQEEIFGPILAVVEVADLDAAIAFINEREKPLALYAFTTSEATKSRLVNETSSGGVTWGQPVMQLPCRDCLSVASAKAAWAGTTAGIPSRRSATSRPSRTCRSTRPALSWSRLSDGRSADGSASGR